MAGCLIGLRSETCDTLQTHTQVLVKLSAELAPAEPQLMHTATDHLSARL
jgi:hypothetical protein